MEHDTEVELSDLLHATAWMTLTGTMRTNMKFKNWQNDHLCAGSVSGQERREGLDCWYCSISSSRWQLNECV